MPSKPHRYAEGTDVPVDRTRAEIEFLLVRHGATAFMTAWSEGKGVVQFRLADRMLRYVVETPDPQAFTSRSNSSAERQAAAEHRRRWRALLLVLKAKLEVVASGESTVDREFLADIMLPKGGTVGDQLIPQVEQAYLDGQMPKLLGPG